MKCPKWLLDAMEKEEAVTCWCWNDEKKTGSKMAIVGFRVGFALSFITVEGKYYFHAEPYKEPEHEFNPFEKVLVRDHDNQVWGIEFFERELHRDTFRYCCMTDSWSYCIPYEGNENLLGTTNDPE